jgi:hypothetical protein
MSAIYEDAYLKGFVTIDIEERAEAEVATYGTFAQEWIDRLLPPQAYIIVCLENQANPDDLFTAKLKTYQKELDRLLAYARSATPDIEGYISPIFGVPMERG